MSRRLDIEPHDPPARRPVQLAVDAIDEGAVVAYPTDTLYALGCAIDSPGKSIDRLYRAKEMPKSQRLSLLCTDLSQVSSYGHLSQAAFRLAQRIFPGPYTLVVPASRQVPRGLLDHRRRMVGVRVPDHPVTQALIRGLGRPLLSTSAITSDGEPCVDGDDTAEAFGDAVDLVIHSGPTPGVPSTVLEVDDEEIRVVREGLGTLDVLG